MVPDSECMIPTLMVSAACAPKLIPIATTDADNAKAFNKVRRCIFSLLKKNAVRKRPVRRGRGKKSVSEAGAKRVPEWRKRYFWEGNAGCKENDSEWYSAALL